MPLTSKTFSNFVSSILSKFFNTLPNVDPNVEGSLAKAISVSAAAAGYSLQDGIQDAVQQSFPQTADGDFLALFGGYDNCTQYPASSASGNVAVGGTLGTLIPQYTNLTYLGLTYQTQIAANIATYSGTMSVVYNSNGTVTVTTTIPHSLSSNLSVAIAGCSQIGYNGLIVITVLSNYVFTYQLGAGLGLTPDSGTYSAVYALLNVKCTTTGQSTNVGAGSGMAISVVSVNTTAYVGVEGLISGTDLESTENYRTRVLQAHNLTPGIATGPAMISSAKKISGITRVYVIPSVNSAVETVARGLAGYIPLLGETMIYCLADTQSPITPTPSQLLAVYNQIFTDGLWPNYVPAANLWVIAPNLVGQNITLSGISPNTASMQVAITAQLSIFFQENSNVSQNVSVKALISFLNKIQDPATGLYLQSYTLTSPTVDMVALSGQLLILGTVTYI